MNEENEKSILVVGGTADPGETEALANAGYVVDFAGSMSGAMEKLASKAYSRVLVDPDALSVLGENEEMYRNLVERSNDGVVVIQDRLVKFANHRFEEMSGYSAQTLLNTPFTDYLTPDELAVLLERYQRRMAGEYVPSLYETTLTRRGGRKIPLEVSAAIVPFHRHPADLVVIRDITERKQAEEYLQRYRLLSENARDIILFIGLDGRIIEANRAAAEAYGYTREELLSMSINDLRVENRRNSIREQMRRAQRESVLFESTHRRKDGTTFPVEVSMSGTAMQNEPVLLDVVRDITERKRAQESLDAERRRLRTVLDALPVAVIVADAQGKFVEVNEQADAMWGGKVPRVKSMEHYGELRGWWADSGEPIAPMDWALSRALTKGETSIGEVIDIECPTGNRMTVLSSAAPIRNAAGHVTGGVMVEQDMTSSKELERRLQEQASTLQVILETVPVGVLMADAKAMEIIYASPEATTILGGPVTGTAMRPEPGTYEVLLPDGGPFPLDELPITRSILSGERVSNVQIRVRRTDGSEILITANSAPVFDAEGHITAAVASMDDVTELFGLRKELERSLEESRRESERIGVLESIAEAGLASLDVQDLLNTIIERVAKALGVDSACVFVIKEEEEMFEAYATYNAPQMLSCRVKLDQGLAGKVAKERRPIYVADAESDPLVCSSCVGRTGAKALLGVPLIARGRVVGAVYVLSGTARQFSDDEVRLLQAICDRVAMAIDNAKLYDALQRSRSDVAATLEQERHYSLLLQRALFPAEPSVGEGYEVAVRYVPVFVAREIGGDFYDVFPGKDGVVGLLIGDVSGKGLEAASLAASTRSTIHAFVHETASAGEVLTRANSVLYSQQPSAESFVTVAVVVLNVTTGELCCSSAGHPPIVILRADGSMEFLSYGNMPLGISPSFNYAQYDNQLNPGDKLLLYTDGISEAHDGSSMFDLEGIERTLAGHSEWNVNEVADQLVAAATEWANGKLRDDAALVVLERLDKDRED